jgi:hypothetical protein
MRFSRPPTTPIGLDLQRKKSQIEEFMAKNAGGTRLVIRHPREDSEKRRAERDLNRAAKNFDGVLTY